jgi:DNA polymerase I-like protein with 3'-5' exonuclease and polymerase domains
VTDVEKADMLGLLKNNREKFIKYSSLDPVMTLLVTQELKKEIIKDKKSLNYFVKFTQPIENEFLFEMERNGIKVDLTKIPAIKAKLKEEMEEILFKFKDKCPPQVYERHKDNFKLTRTIIMQESLFEWVDTKFRKNQTVAEHHNYGFNLEPVILSPKSGMPSTDKKQVLKVILDDKYSKKVKELVQLYIDWGERKQLLGNFIKNIEYYATEDSRLHPSASLTFTSSGRTGFKSPNLQNQPKRGALAKIIRQLFVADDGMEIIENDYKASELAWVAQVSGDKKMTRIFREGKDPHKMVGLSMKHLPEDYEFKTQKELKELRQHTKCFHPDTEVLTKAGWKKLSELKKDEKIYQAEPKDNEKVKLSLVKPTFLEIRKNHCKTLVNLQNEGIDLKVTPDHRMLIQRVTGKYEVVKPEDFNKCRYYINSGIVEQGYEINERLLRLAVLTQADGSYVNSTIRFGFKKQNKIKRFESLFKENEYTKTIVGKKYSYTSYYINPDIGKKIRSLLNDDKTFNWKWLELSKKCRKIIIDEARYWDSHKAKDCNQYIYSSTIEKNVDVLQAICSISGVKTNKRSDQGKRHPEHNRMYYLSVKKTWRSRGENVKVTQKSYADNVAVLSVPSSFVMVRSGGKVLITGQCINFGLIYLMEAHTLVKYAKQEFNVTFTKKQAQEAYDKYFQEHYGIKEWHEKDLAFLRKNGYLRTIFGRKQSLPNVYSENDGTAAAAERTGINSMIQGPSSDMTLLSGHRIIKDGRVDKDEFKIVLFVHDALLWCCVPEKKDYYLSIVKEYMETPPDVEFGFTMEVPLNIEAEIGTNLAEMNEYKL